MAWEIQSDNYSFGNTVTEGHYLVITREVSLPHSDASISNILSFNFTLSKCALLMCFISINPIFWISFRLLRRIMLLQMLKAKNYCSDMRIGGQIIHNSQKGELAFVGFIYLNYTLGNKRMTACISFYNLHIFPKIFTVVQTGYSWPPMLITKILKHCLNPYKSLQITLERRQNQCTALEGENYLI